jgi:hypothetical protein
LDSAKTFAMTSLRRIVADDAAVLLDLAARSI